MVEVEDPLPNPAINSAIVHFGDISEEREFSLVADPRVANDGISDADLALQETVLLQLREMASTMNRTIREIDDELEAAADSDVGTFGTI